MRANDNFRKRFSIDAMNSGENVLRVDEGSPTGRSVEIKEDHPRPAVGSSFLAADDSAETSSFECLFLGLKPRCAKFSLVYK